MIQVQRCSKLTHDDRSRGRPVRGTRYIRIYMYMYMYVHVATYVAELRGPAHQLSGAHAFNYYTRVRMPTVN